MSTKITFQKGTMVEVVGNVASGKTTLSKQLSKVTNLRYQDTDLFENNPFMVPSVEDPKRWVFTEELYFYYLRSKKVPEVIRALKKYPLVLDQGFHMPSFMYTNNRLKQGHMTKDEFNFINDLFEILMKDAPIPDTVIFLDIPVDELSRRMDRRGRIDDREHEKLYTDAYLSQLNIGLLEYIDQMKKMAKSIIIYNQSKDSINTFGYKNVALENVIYDLIHSLDH